MLNPLKWERVDQVRLLFAAAFGVLWSASLPALESSGSIYLAHSSARSLWAGGFIIIGLLGSALMPRRFPAP